MPHKTVSFSKNAVNVFFHILTRCNLNCRHCYINPEQHGCNRLSLETIKNWLDQFSPQKKKANVIFLGGEPTLHPELPAAVAYAKKAGYRSVTIDTNGYLFHNILEKTSPEIVDYISFSLDGVIAETNDAIRGQGSYKKCLEGIRAAVHKGFRTSLIYTVNTLNIGELEKISGLVEVLGVDTLFLQVLGLRGKSAQEKGNIDQVSRQQWRSIVPETAERVAQKGIRVIYPKVYLEKTDLFECAGLVAQNYFIFPNGRVYRCPLCEDFPFHSLAFTDNILAETPKINETDFFLLSIPEGCVFNKLIQPENLRYHPDGTPEYKIACCMLKEEISLSL